MRDLTKLADVELPVGSLLDAAPHLRRPFARAAVKWKVQSVWKGNEPGAEVVAHVDARLVIERFNAVVPHLWSHEFAPVSDKLLMCVLTVDGVTRRDVGEGTGKALYSDALKRAAVHFGVAVSVYALPRLSLRVGTGNANLRPDFKGRPAIDDRTLESLRTVYDLWLGRTGVPMFGPVLDHGDVEDSQGADDDEPEVEGAEPAEDAAPAMPALETEEAVNVRALIEGIYAEIRKIDARRLPPGEFRRRLDAAAHSMEALRQLRDDLIELRNEWEKKGSTDAS